MVYGENLISCILPVLKVINECKVLGRPKGSKTAPEKLKANKVENGATTTITRKKIGKKKKVKSKSPSFFWKIWRNIDFPQQMYTFFLPFQKKCVYLHCLRWSYAFRISLRQGNLQKKVKKKRTFFMTFFFVFAFFCLSIIYVLSNFRFRGQKKRTFFQK